MCRLSSFISTGEICKFNALHMHKSKISDPLKGLDIRPFRCAIRGGGWEMLAFRFYSNITALLFVYFYDLQQRE